MAIFVELITSPGDGAALQGSKSQQGGGRQRAGAAVARRPARGIEIKSDTYSTLKVIKSDGTVIPLVDSSKGGLSEEGYTNFMLQSVTEQRMEKHQIIETFGASYVFFFGEQPRFLNVAAMLLNTNDFNWEAEWWANYNTYFRGTKLVEMGARCYLSYDDVVVEGYMMHATCNKTADGPYVAQLQFQFFVTNCYNVSDVGSSDFPLRYSVTLPDNIEFQSGDAGQPGVSNLQGAPLLGAQANALPAAGANAANAAESGEIGVGRTITQLVRDLPPSFAVSPDYWPLLESSPELRDLTYRAGVPLRSLISDNLDEYVSGWDGYGLPATNVLANPARPGSPIVDSPPNLPPPLQNPARTRQEASDLFKDATEQLSSYGADINNPEKQKELGLSPNFAPSANGKGASFSPMADGGFGFSPGTGVGAGAVAGGSAEVGATTSGDSDSAFSADQLTGSFQSDSLGVVYGRRTQKKTRFSNQTQKVEETGFDFNYGYQSDYASGPGFGRAGFGDMGGNSYGSANSGGDPGYKDPDLFSFSGVVEGGAAFERFTRKRKDRTAITKGPQVGRGDVSGAASVTVGGRVSAFALVSLEGVLFPAGDAREQPEYTSAYEQARIQGFQPTPPLLPSSSTPA